jgi:hypothetical protein
MDETPRDESLVEAAAETKHPYHKPTFRAFGTVRELTHATPFTGQNPDSLVQDYSTTGYGGG